MPRTKFFDITGQRFGRYVAVEHVGNGNWLCKCDCGNEKIVKSGHLRSGKTRSCGCLRHDVCKVVNKTHGGSSTRLYSVWQSIKKRCNDKKQNNYKNYGGRGIKICEEWGDFSKFSEWAYENGYDDNAPFGQCTIERIDNDGDYCPENCRWANMSEQAKNRRKCRKPNLWKPVVQIDEDGNKIRRYPSVRDAARDLGLSEVAISAVCKGKYHTTKGTRWRYAEKDD